MRFGSLFAGIGGIDLGLERAGMTCTWQVEIDPWCQRVLAKHWPHVPRFADVRTVGARELDPVDLICGGFPCQDISNAGRRRGIDGDQSGLWREFARILCELRPEYALVENVAALRVRGLGRVLGNLAACGYDAEWDCVPAAAVGAPHLRDRLFVVAHARRERERLEPESQSRGGGTHVVGHDGEDRDVAGAAGSRWWPARSVLPEGAEGRRALREFARRGWWFTEPDVGRVAARVSARVDRLRGLGNAVVPQVAEYVGHFIARHALGAAA